MILKWIKETQEAYLANPNSIRDFRTQMRGDKAPRLWGLYSGLLIIFAILMYASTVRSGVSSIAEVQDQLRQFYNMIIGLLETAVLLASPVLAVNLITGEYERRSMDLILSSPMSIRTFLVGKLISAWRVVWMIILLALPIASVCVVMGGANWGDVMSAFLLIALKGLVCAALAIPIAIVTRKVVPSVLSSLVAVYGLVILLGISSTFWLSPIMMGGSPNVPFFAGLVPYMTGMVASAPTDAFGISLPVWLTAIPVAGILTWLCMLGSGAALTGWGSKESRRFRTAMLAASGVVGLLVGLQTTASTMSAFGVSGPIGLASNTSIGLALLTAGLIVFLPHLATWKWFGEKKESPGPLISLKSMLNGGPGGAIPFGLSVLGLFSIASYVSSTFLGAYNPGFFHTLLWCVIAFLGSVACYRTASATAPLAGGYPKRSGTALLLAFAALPLPVVSILGAASSEANEWLWCWVPLSGLFLQDVSNYFVNIVVMTVLTIGLFVFSEKSRAKREKAIEDVLRADERPPIVHNAPDTTEEPPIDSRLTVL